MMKLQKWNTPDYQRIRSAKFANGQLSTTFDDGTTVTIDPDPLLPPGVHSPAWGALRTDDPYELVVSTSQGETAIPWTTIRLLSDKEFAAHWAQAAGQQAQHVGLRLKELRKKRKLTSREVATRAGIAPQSLSRIEHGHHDVVFTTLEKILAAMGCSLSDLAETQVTSSSTGALLEQLGAVD